MLPLQVTTPAAAPEPLSLWQLCVDGGWIMIILALLLVISLYVLIERSIVTYRAARYDETFMKRIKDYIHDGETGSALNVDNESTGNLEVAALSKGLPWLATTAAGAPMLGFLGTVTGMVQAFYSIASAGTAASIGDFAGGIYTALVTPVTALSFWTSSTNRQASESRFDNKYWRQGGQS